MNNKVCVILKMFTRNSNLKTKNQEKIRPKNKKTIGIRTKLILLMLIITTLSVLSVGLLSYQAGKNIINQQIQRLLSIQTEKTLESINKFIFDRQNDMQVLIGDSTLISKDASNQEKKEVLRKKMINLGWYEEFHLTDPNGKVVVSTHPKMEGVMFEGNEWFNEAKKNFIGVSDIMAMPSNKKNGLLISNTIQNQNNEIIGYLVAELSLSIITDLLKKTPKNFEAYLISKEGKVITFRGPPLLENSSVSQARIYQLPTTYLQQQIKSEGYFSFNGNEWTLAVQTLKKTAYEPINSFSYLLGIFTFLITLLVIIIGHFSSKTFVKPILLLTEGVSQVKKGLMDQKIEIKSNDEVGYLASSFNEMTSEISKKTNNLIEERGKYKTILESSNEGIILFDTKNNLVTFNHEFQRFFYEKKHQIPRKAEKTLSFISKTNVDEESKKNADLLQKIIQKNDFEKQANLSLVLKKPYGIYALYTKPVLGEDGRLLGRIWVFNNITQEVESERSRAQFIHVASHKLRTPLTTVNWNAQMLMDGTFGKLNKDQGETIKQIKEASNELSALSNILMNVAEIKKDQVTIEKTIFSLKSLLEKSSQDIKNKTEGRPDVSLKSHLMNLKGVNVKGDFKKLKEVLDIILDNAIRYKKEGKKNKVELSVELDKKNKKAIVSVSDQGIGIKEENKTKIFGQFFRSKRAELIYPDGTGLSLFLTKIILHSSGEKIWFEATENKGATFHFTIQLA